MGRPKTHKAERVRFTTTLHPETFALVQQAGARIWAASPDRGVSPPSAGEVLDLMACYWSYVRAERSQDHNTADHLRAILDKYAGWP